MSDERRHETTVDGQVAWAGLWHDVLGGRVCHAYTNHGQSSVAVYIYDSGDSKHLMTYIPKGLSLHMVPVVSAILIEAVHIAETGEVPQ